MALNRGNLRKNYVNAVKPKGMQSSSSAEDRLILRKGDVQDLLMVILPPIAYHKDGTVETYPNQEDGIYTYFRSVHPKIGKGGQQTIDCLSSWNEECPLCSEYPVKKKWNPYVILVHEVKKQDGSIAYLPASKPLVADFPPSLGDSWVALISDEDNSPCDNLEELPIYKYNRTGESLDTTHSLTQRPLNHKFGIKSLGYLDTKKENDKTTYVAVREPVNPLFGEMKDIWAYISVNPATRLYKPSATQLQAAKLGLDIYMKDETLKAMVLAETRRGNRSSVKKQTEDSFGFEVSDEDIPF